MRKLSKVSLNLFKILKRGLIHGGMIREHDPPPTAHYNHEVMKMARVRGSHEKTLFAEFSTKI
ncbi:hypothetical protein WN943_005503 [Citrus x changshan-huyou]